MLLLTKEELKETLKKYKTKSCTYGLCRNNGELFYVGVGIRNRVFQHDMEFEFKASSNRHKTNITKKERTFGGILYILFMVNKNRQICLNIEKALIEKYGRIDNATGCLTNLTNGGEIGPTGAIVSDSTRKKQSEVVQRRITEISSQQRMHWLSMSEADKSLRISNMHSTHGTPEYLAKLSKAQLKKWEDPLYKERLSGIQKIAQTLIASDHSRRTTEYWAKSENKAHRLEQNRLRRLKKSAVLVTPISNEQVAAPE